jgi:hypothetical protein
MHASDAKKCLENRVDPIITIYGNYRSLSKKKETTFRSKRDRRAIEARWGKKENIWGEFFYYYYHRHQKRESAPSDKNPELP